MFQVFHDKTAAALKVLKGTVDYSEGAIVFIELIITVLKWYTLRTSNHVCVIETKLESRGTFLCKLRWVFYHKWCHQKLLTQSRYKKNQDANFSNEWSICGNDWKEHPGCKYLANILLKIIVTANSVKEIQTGGWLRRKEKLSLTT